jgi:hypothetical protein
MDTKMIEISEVQLESDPRKGNMVILRERESSDRYFMMFVGDAEFAAIAMEKGLVEPKRPFTHQLYLSIIDKMDMKFIRVEINDLKDGTYYANVIFQVDGQEMRVDSRPSDAVALALNRKIPILVREDLFRKKLTQEQIKEYEDLVKTVKF